MVRRVGKVVRAIIGYFLALKFAKDLLVDLIYVGILWCEDSP
jgi:hypothetical protein